MFSDGYQDQFGGPKGKKFMVKKLNKLFVEIAALPLTEQVKILKSTFEKWKGNEEQVDDVLILIAKI
jgi:serine phosphatase RsbU (regulator of sigma subunit)